MASSIKVSSDILRIHRSVDFILEKIKDGNNYNFFVDEDDCEAEWKLVLKQSRYYVRLNEQKLYFILSRFHIITRVRPPSMMLDKDYLSSEEFLHDLGTFCFSIYHNIQSYLKHLSDIGKIEIERIKPIIDSIYVVSISFSSPLPMPWFTPEKSPPSMTRSYLETYCTIDFNIKDVSATIFPDLSKKFTMDIEYFEKSGIDERYVYSICSFHSELKDKFCLADFCLQPLKEIFHIKYKFSYIPQREYVHNRDINEESSLKFTKEEVNYKIPIELALNGISELIENGKNTFMLEELLMVTFYRMLQYSSNLAFIIDTESIIVL
ncbi:hypothetical protein DFJ63DRAFT_312163 [Scheffersomyces coipomensis]|uniref:uncharacterized protein n=1 Tax=Scheffersomyces coipomensis TaxID=1788519 RepID=UPI00315DEFEF